MTYRIMLRITGGLLLLVAVMLGAWWAVLPPTTSSASLADVPTATPVLPTATAVPVVPTDTPVPVVPTDTPVPVVPTDTPVPVVPTDTPVPVPPTATPVPVAPPADDPPPPPPPASPTPSATPTTAPPLPVVPPTDLAIAKQADVTTARPGDLVVFTIRLSTTLGATVLTDLVVRDAVPAVFEVVDLRSERGNIVLSGQEVVAYPRTMEPGEALEVQVTARVRPDAPAGPIINTATATFIPDPGDPGGPRTSTVQVTIVRDPVPPAVIIPPSLPRTADPSPSLLWALPWVLLGLVICGTGLFVLSYRHRLPVLRIPVRQMQVEVAPSADGVPHGGGTGAAGPRALQAWQGEALPPPTEGEPLPHRPGRYEE